MFERGLPTNQALRCIRQGGLSSFAGELRPNRQCLQGNIESPAGIAFQRKLIGNIERKGPPHPIAGRGVEGVHSVALLLLRCFNLVGELIRTLRQAVNISSQQLYFVIAQ